MENLSNDNALPVVGVVDQPQIGEDFNESEFDNGNTIDEVEFDNENSQDFESDSEKGETVEIAEPQEDEGQSREENSQYKKMRLRAEKEAREKIEKEMELARKEIQAQKIELQQQVSEKKIVEEYLNPKKIYEYADEHNITEEQAEKILRYEAQRVVDAEKMRVREKFTKLQADKNDLRQDKYFALLEKEVDAIVEQDPTIDYKAVYYYHRGLRSDEFDKQLAKNVEQRTVANMQDRARRRNIKSDAGNDSLITPSEILDNDAMDLTLAFGNDPREIAKYVKQNYKKKGR